LFWVHLVFFDSFIIKLKQFNIKLTFLNYNVVRILSFIDFIVNDLVASGAIDTDMNRYLKDKKKSLRK